MHAEIINSLDDLSAGEWNALAGDDNPFLRHEFLAALERHDCVGERWGWLPRHVTVREDGRLVGAAPMYLKDNSYGELVFDWGWAEAYARAGLAYYPKLVVAIPYTPVTGPRILGVNDTARRAVVAAAMDYARESEVSSIHFLFTDEADTRLLGDAGLLKRSGCQFHWHNHEYRNFDAFLAHLNAKKRKEIRRERRQVSEAGVELLVLRGADISDEQWAAYHAFYTSTFARKSGYATLSLAFFQALGREMPDNVLLILARRAGRYIAGGFNLLGGDTLYGRHWGCVEYVKGLHFEVCYYRAIQYCIEHGIRHFEAGAQGEHKIARGFVPTDTYSMHWLSHAEFHQAVAHFVAHEEQGVRQYMQVLGEHAPFRRD